MITSLVLFFAGIVAYVVSTLSGGGGALLLLPIVGFYLGAAQVAPVVNLGNMIGRPVRLYLFWSHIRWEVIGYYVPSAVLGAILGSFLLSEIRADWLQLILGLFLISTVFQFRWGKRKRSFMVYKWHFIPLGFLITFISAVMGATGAVLNPFYLNYGLIKEELVATKTANSFLAGIFTLSGYTFFGSLHGDLWLYGLVIGLGATVGNIIGKKALQRLNEESFRKLVILIMVISGIGMIIRSI